MSHASRTPTASASDEFQRPIPVIPSSRLGGRDWAIAGAVALLGVLLCIALGNRRGLWLDEYYTLNAARLGLREMIRERLSLGHSPVYFFYARLGLLLGQSERALRLSSALALGAAVLLMTGLAGALGLRRHLPALWAVSLLHPYWIDAGTEYRYMMPIIALTAAAAWAAFLYTRTWDWRRGALLAGLAGLLLWIHGSAQFIIAGLLVFVLWEARARAGAWRASLVLRAWPLLAGYLSSIPFLFLVKGYQGDSTQPRLVHAGEMIKDLSAVVFNRHELWPAAFGAIPVGGVILLACLGTLLTAIWLARSELRAHGAHSSWRLLAGLLAGIPLTQAVINTFMRHVQGPARYDAGFSVPATFCLAVAWNASTLSPRRRKAFRWLLAACLVIQFSASALERGDLHREGIQWLLAHRGGAKVFLSSRTINTLAVNYVAGRKVERLATMRENDREKKAAVLEKFRRIFKGERRGFLFLYHSPERLDLQYRLAELQDEGFIKACRTFEVSGEVRIYAFILDNKEKPWLESLPPFKRPWGPARGITHAFTDK